jgi:hypothetical protein
MSKKRKRLNWDIPVDLVPAVRIIADTEGLTVPFWLRKTLEKAIKEKFLETSVPPSVRP